MLKITKGLKPTIEDGIMSYIDDDGNEYVRVKMDDEDFCIALHDYIKDGHILYTWFDAMMSLDTDGLTLPTKKQVGLYSDNLVEINNKLREMGGKVLLKGTWYWTSAEIDANHAWNYCSNSGGLVDSYKKEPNHVRPILDLIK